MTRHSRLTSRRRAGSRKRIPLLDPSARPRFRRLALECLENRRLLAIYTAYDFDSEGLTISSDAADKMVIGSNDVGEVTVNDLVVRVEGDPLLASDVRHLRVLGGPGDNEIRLVMRRSQFPFLTEPVYVEGNAGNDRIEIRDGLRSTSFQTILHGGAGDDYLFGGCTMLNPHDPAQMFGDDGNDILEYEFLWSTSGTSVPEVDGGPGDDQWVVTDESSQVLKAGEWITAEKTVVLRGIERAHLKLVDRRGDQSRKVLSAAEFPGNVILEGSDRDETLIGGGGDDKLIGRGGMDILYGGLGNDDLNGGPGFDSYFFQDAGPETERDWVEDLDFLERDPGGRNQLVFDDISQTIDSSQYAVELDLSASDGVSHGRTNNREIDICDPELFNVVSGSPLADWLRGSSKNDTLLGHGGNDLLEGGAGDDTLVGGDGDDSLLGGDGNDRLEGGLGDDRLLGDEGKDRLDGGGGDDILHGGPGFDELYDPAGNDQLFGGPGDDTLTGGPGADIFVPGGGKDLTDAKADVAVVASGPTSVTLGPPNTSVDIPYTAELLNNGEDYAHNVTIRHEWTGVVARVPVELAVGAEVLDPVTGQGTGVRVIPPALTTNYSNVTGAGRAGRGTYVVSASTGVPYVQDPLPTNNRSQVETEVRGNSVPVQPPKAKLVTKNAAGDKTGNAGVYKFSKSGVNADGKKAVFTSWATNYDTVPPAVPGEHVFVGDPVMVDVIPSGQSSGDSISFAPSLSADGRYVAFASLASNLVTGVTDTNDATDIFVRDLVAGTTRLVSASTAGGITANGDSDEPLISGDGRYVVFHSQATDLVPGFPPGTTTRQVYRADLQTGTIQLVSVSASGSGPANGDSHSPEINHDGRYVVWSSSATDAVSGVTDTNGQDDFFVRDMTAGTTKLVTINYLGTAAANGLHRPDVEITPDGAYITYASYATDLVNLPDPASFSSDVFIYDVLPGTNRLVSVSSDGTRAGNAGSYYPTLSSDGRYVAFESQALNLVAGDPPTGTRVYVRDLTLNVTQYGAPTSAGTGPAAHSASPSLSGDGRYLAFRSTATDLVDGFVDGNGASWSDVYVRDRQTGKTTLMSVNHLGTASGNGNSSSPAISRDGQVVYFLSRATDLVAGVTDTNNESDLFAADYHVAVPDTALRYTAPAGGPNRMTLRKNGANLEIVRDADGEVLASKVLADTTIVVVTGADAADDQLTLDLAAGGFFSLAGGVNFSGGAAGHDTLVLRGSVTAVRYDATGASDGFVTAETETEALPIAYSGLEPIVDETTAADRFFASWLTGNVQIRLSDDADPNNGRMVIDAAGTGAFESIAFGNPTRLLSLAGGNGNDTLTVASLDNGLAAALSLAGGAGNDVLDASAFGGATTLDGGFGDDVLRGGSGDTRYIVTPGSRDELHDAGVNDTLDFSGAFAPVTVDLDLQGTDQTLDGGGNKLQINGQIENFVGSVYADVVWATPLAVPRDVRAGAALPGETVFDQLRVRTHDPAATNDAGTIAVPGFAAIQTGDTFAQVSMWLPPVAVEDHPVTQIGTAVVIPVAGNDTDPENDPFAVSAVTQPAHGTAVLNGDGTVTYTPEAGFFGLDQFTYTTRDLLGGGSTATVNVRVNRPPDAVDDAVTNTIVTVDVLANDTDPDGDPLSVTAIAQPADGAAVLNANGAITYTPPVGFQGTALIPYTISDGFGGADMATLTVTVRPVNDPPTFTPGPDQTISAGAGLQTVANWATDILPGPPDEAGQSIEFFTATDKPELFAVLPAISPTGTLTYAPAAGVTGTAVVLVQAVDDGGTADGGSDASAIAVFAVTVVVPLADGSLQFDGSDDRVTIPSAAALNFGSGSSITLEAWVKPEGLASYNTILAKGQTAGSLDANYVLRVGDGASETRRLTFSYLDPGGVIHVYRTDADAIQAGRWQHVAASYTFGDAASMKLYVDGVLRSGTWTSGHGNAAPVVSGDPLLIGASNGTEAEPWNGRIDEVRIWNYARTEEQIRVGLEPHLVGNESGLAACWEFSEMIGSQSVLDKTANGNNGTLGSTAGVEASDPGRVEHPHPAAEIGAVTPNPRGTPVGLVTVNFSEAVTGVDRADFRLTRDGSPVDLSGLTVTQVTEAQYTLDLSTVTASSGSYVLTLAAGGSGIRGLVSDYSAFSEDVSTSWITQTLRVTDLFPTASGFVATFNAPLEASVLNLYDGAAQTLGPADVIVTGAVQGVVRGSLVISTDRQQFAFVQTGGLLEPDTYTVTLFSGDTRFRDTAGRLLDGNNDGTAGDDYQTSFTVSARPAGAVTISLPDFARGAGQSVNVPNTAGGLPIRLDNAAGVTSLAVDLVYDPALLTITAATLAAGLPGDWSVTLDTSTPGVAKIRASGAALSGMNLDVVRLTAAVPAGASYGAVQAIRLENVSLNGGTIAAVGDVAVHKAVYLGDGDGSGMHSSADAFLTVQAALAVASGFPAHAWADPRIVADVDGSGVLSAADAFLIVQEGLGVSEPFVPDNPHIGITPVGGGIDPQFRIGDPLAAGADGAVSVPVQLAIEPGATNVGGLDFDLFFDPVQLTIEVPGGVSAGADTAGWAISAALIDAGHLRVGMVSSRGWPLVPGLREIARLQFRVEAEKASRTGWQPVLPGCHRSPIPDVLHGSETHPPLLDIEPVDPRAGGYIWTARAGR